MYVNMPYMNCLPWSTWWWGFFGIYIYRSYDDLRGISLGMLTFEAWNTDGVVLQAGDFPRGCKKSWPRELVGEELVVFQKRAPLVVGCLGLFFGGWMNYFPVMWGVLWTNKAWHIKDTCFFVWWVGGGVSYVTTLEPPQPRPKRMIWW